MATPTALIFFLIIFITIISSFHFSYSIKNNGILCPETEQHALLSFKLSLQDSNNSLSSWKPQVDCCMWEYVVCSNLTGHVYELHLDNDYQLNFRNPSFLSGKLNPSLLNLTHLRYLNLGYNNFEGEIPSFIGSFPKLEYLNLSYSGFNGTIPHTIGNLSTLHTLSLQTYYRLNVDSLEWLSGVSQLEYLEMIYVDLSKANNWLQVINTLPSLVELHFQGCSLEDSAPLSEVNFSSLAVLDLSFNNFQNFPKWIYNCKNLEYVNMEFSMLHGSISKALGNLTFLSGKLNPSLLNLTHLRYLNLFDNNFEGEIPSFIGSFPKLEYLNLSDSGFNGTIPHTIGNLSTLHTLSLQSQWLNVDSLEWLSGVSQLEYLDMSFVNLNKANNWLQVINTLPSLVELHFQGCSLEDSAPLSEVNFSSLAVLDLSSNNFQNFPKWIYNCKNLEYVNMAASNLHGSISKALGNLTFLSQLDLSYNDLSGEIPSEITNLCRMRVLYLHVNKLSGDISNTFGNMSTCFLRSLETLYLSFNLLSGNLSDQFGEFKSLQTLVLSRNSLSGPIPNLPSLTKLQLGANRFTGNLPENLGQLSNLEYFSAENNMLEGIVSESHFVNLTKLIHFSASGNHLTLKVTPNWIPPFNLSWLGLGSWNLGEDGQIPRWLETQKNYISWLDLSNTGLNSTVPKWIWKIPSYLNLSHNQLHGNIPDIASTLTELDLSNNSFSGGMSKFLCIDKTNETSYGLQFLHIGENRLSGELPDCWMRWPILEYLNLDNNDLSGSIPTSFEFLATLRSLNLQNNSFSGEIPTSMQQCTSLEKINLGGNKLVGNIPSWTTYLYRLRCLILRSNKLTGNISPNLCHNKYLQILDLSDNIFSGVIPTCVHNFTLMATKTLLVEEYSSFSITDTEAFQESVSLFTKGEELQYDKILYLVTSINLSGNNLSGDIPKQLTSLVGLRSLNLSRNHLTGSIPDAIGDMKQLESIDLSRNSLSGEIPNSLGDISSLSYLNLSYNNLTGSIPQSTQLMSLNASAFIGNNLCGFPLMTCNNDGETPVSRDKENGGVGKSEVDWLYVFISVGYAVGISAFFATLILNKSLRDAYFGLLEDMWEKYVSKK